MGRLEPRPDAHDPGYRIVQTAKMASTDLIKHALHQSIVVNQLVTEVLREIPDADFIEIRAIKYTVIPKEGNDERTITGAPPWPPAD